MWEQFAKSVENSRSKKTNLFVPIQQAKAVLWNMLVIVYEQSLINMQALVTIVMISGHLNQLIEYVSDNLDAVLVTFFVVVHSWGVLSTTLTLKNRYRDWQSAGQLHTQLWLDVPFLYTTILCPGGHAIVNTTFRLHHHLVLVCIYKVSYC